MKRIRSYTTRDSTNTHLHRSQIDIAREMIATAESYVTRVVTKEQYVLSMSIIIDLLVTWGTSSIVIL